MDLFRVDVTDAGDLMLRGELDAANADEVRELAATHRPDRDPLVVDVSRLTFVDAAGFGAIASLASAVPGRSVVLRSPRPNVTRVFDILVATRPENLVVELAPVAARGHGRSARSRSPAGAWIRTSLAKANVRARTRLGDTLDRMFALGGRLRGSVAAMRRTSGESARDRRRHPAPGNARAPRL